MSCTHDNSCVLKLTNFIKNFCDITFSVESMNHLRVLTHNVFYNGERFYPPRRFFLLKRAVSGFNTCCCKSFFLLCRGFLFWWSLFWLSIPKFLPQQTKGLTFLRFYG